MAHSLDIAILPTYNVETIAVSDLSTYDPSPPTTPTLEINVPNFGSVYLTFAYNQTNIFDSTDLGLTTAGNEVGLPDGIYCFKYTVDPANTYYVEKSIMRVDRLQLKFDEAFMRLDMMECDQPIKKQSMVDLQTIYFYIQGAIAAANNCATVESQKLYIQANNMLDGMIATNCGCSGSNYQITFQ